MVAGDHLQKASKMNKPPGLTENMKDEQEFMF